MTCSDVFPPLVSPSISPHLVLFCFEQRLERRLRIAVAECHSYRQRMESALKLAESLETELNAYKKVTHSFHSFHPSFRIVLSLSFFSLNLKLLNLPFHPSAYMVCMICYGRGFVTLCQKHHELRHRRTNSPTDIEITRWRVSERAVKLWG